MCTPLEVFGVLAVIHDRVGRLIEGLADSLKSILPTCLQPCVAKKQSGLLDLSSLSSSRTLCLRYLMLHGIRA